MPDAAGLDQRPVSSCAMSMSPITATSASCTGLSLAVRPGVITGVIGPNGAGKSTALKALYGLAEAGRRRRPDRWRSGHRHAALAVHRARHRAGAAAAQPVQRTVGRRQPAARLLVVSPRPGARRGGAGARLCAVPDAARQAPRPRRGHERRPAALPRAGPGAGAAAARDPARRADGHDRAARQRGDLRVHPWPAGAGITVLLVDQNVRQCVRISRPYLRARARPATRSTARPAPSRRTPACAT